MKFSGPVRVEWVVDHPRDMILLEPLTFYGKQRNWTAPEGARINGVSFPRILWSIVGSPYTTKARRTSVLHDYFCTIRNYPYQEVHLMFYYGCITDGVKHEVANVMYDMLMKFGIRWTADGRLIKPELDYDIDIDSIGG